MVSTPTSTASTSADLPENAPVPVQRQDVFAAIEAIRREISDVPLSCVGATRRWGNDAMQEDPGYFEELNGSDWFDDYDEASALADFAHCLAALSQAVHAHKFGGTCERYWLLPEEEFCELLAAATVIPVPKRVVDETITALGHAIAAKTRGVSVMPEGNDARVAHESRLLAQWCEASDTFDKGRRTDATDGTPDRRGSDRTWSPERATTTMEPPESA